MITDSELSMKHVVAQAEGILATDMNGEKVTLSIAKGKYFNMGAIGGRIWELLSPPIEVQEVVRRLMEEYQVDQETCEEHVLSFLQQLWREELIRVS